MSTTVVRTRACRGVAIAVAATLASAGIALAAKQVKGATYIGYKGAAETVEAVSFKVSANGRKVIDLSVETPFKCSGGCGGVGSPTGGSARISRQGTFKVKLKIPAPGSRQKRGNRHRDGRSTPTGRPAGRSPPTSTAAAPADEELDRDRLRCAGRQPAKA